jgi:hypothetical protein
VNVGKDAQGGKGLPGGFGFDGAEENSVSNKLTGIAAGVVLTAVSTLIGSPTAHADTTCGTLSNMGRTGTVYVVKGSANCSQARATIQGVLTGPTVDVSGTGRGRQYTDSSGTVWHVYWPGAAEPDQRLQVWDDSGTGLAWG